MFYSLRLICCAAGALALAACGSSGGNYYSSNAAGGYYSTPSGAAEASAILGPVATWNPVPGQPSRPGSASYGQVDVNNGYINSSQTYAAWNSSGAAFPKDIVRQQRRLHRDQLRRQRYNGYYQQPRRRCYDEYRRRSYPC